MSVVSFPERPQPATKRWHVIATYPNGECAWTDIEELSELHDWIERGSDWTGAKIAISHNCPEDRGARLTAAAPKLLESVKTFLSEHELMGASDDAPSIISARALVAEIEGKGE